MAPPQSVKQMCDEPVTVQIIERIADREQLDPRDLDRPLYDAVDPDALDALFRCDDADVTVEFRYLGYRVVVDGEGEIEITEGASDEGL